MDWLTPIGPLSFSLTQPISKVKSDRTETFRFNLGTTLMIKKHFFSLLFYLFSFNNTFVEEKIAFIDLNYIYSNSKIGKKIIKEIQSKKSNLIKILLILKKLDEEKDLLKKECFSRG